MAMQVINWVMGFGQTIFWAVLVLGLLIFIHELGHHLVAKWLKIGVSTFSLGFGCRIWGFQRGETEYRVSLIPLGGYVKLVGEDPEAQPDNPDIPKEPDEPEKSFYLRPVSHRLAVISAGPLFNVALAILLSWGLHLGGIPVPGTWVGGVLPDTPAQKATLQAGDHIVAIDGKRIQKWSELVEIIRRNADNKLVLTVERGRKSFETSIIPTSKSATGKELGYGRIGISIGQGTYTERFGFFESLGKGFEQNYRIASLTVITLYSMLTKTIPADIGGPIRISVVAAEQAQRGFRYLIMFTILLSINLAILNLLPIPVLDGGHIFFLLIEALRGKPISLRVREVAMQVGTVLLIGLMIFATYKDSVYYLFGRDSATITKKEEQKGKSRDTMKLSPESQKGGK